jgi:hypothetical protein
MPCDEVTECIDDAANNNLVLLIPYIYLGV